MANQWRIAVVTCVVLFMMMEGAKPVLATKVWQKIRMLEDRVKALEETCTDKCQPCKFDFEDGTLGGWFKTGTVFNNQPTYGDNPTARKRGQSAKQQGDYWIGGFEDRHTPNDKPGASQGDGPKGTLTSPVFKITGRYITFLIGGGCDAAWIRVELLVDYKVEKTATGKCHEAMERVTWDVIGFYGQKAHIRLIDNSSGKWGHINFDDLKGDISCDITK